MVSVQKVADSGDFTGKVGWKLLPGSRGEHEAWTVFKESEMVKERRLKLHTNNDLSGKKATQLDDYH